MLFLADGHGITHPLAGLPLPHTSSMRILLAFVGLTLVMALPYEPNEATSYYSFGPLP